MDTSRAITSKWRRIVLVRNASIWNVIEKKLKNNFKHFFLDIVVYALQSESHMNQSLVDSCVIKQFLTQLRINGYMQIQISRVKCNGLIEYKKQYKDILPLRVRGSVTIALYSASYLGKKDFIEFATQSIPLQKSPSTKTALVEKPTRPDLSQAKVLLWYSILLCQQHNVLIKDCN